MTLKETRQKIGITQFEMSKIFGLRSNSYARLERGEKKLTPSHQSRLTMLEFICDHELYNELMIYFSRVEADNGYR